MSGRLRDGLRRMRDADRLLVAVVLAWLVWAVAAQLWSARPVQVLSPYLVAPVVLLAGVVVGRVSAGLRHWWLTPAISAVVAWVVLVGDSFYANAQAAFGVQVAALGGLVLPHLPADATGPGNTVRAAPRSVPLVLVAAALLVPGVLLAARSQAALVLLLPLVVVGVAAVARRWAPPRQRVIIAGLAIVCAAAAAVAWLGGRPTWPEALNAGGSLSQARHRLWADALDLWSQHPLIGSGPGSFVEHSELAATVPHLDTVHSSVLQVGSELGLIGVALFLALIAAGMVVATRGVGPAGTIGVAAWTALGVHSMIDHLYEFPVVTLMAGVALGLVSRDGPRSVEPADTAAPAA